MALIDINTNPSRKQLRQFGLLSLLSLPLAAWLWTGLSVFAAWALAVGFCLALIGQFAPRILRPVFIGLILITAPIGIVVTEVILLLAFFGLFLPLSLLFRLLGRDALQRHQWPHRGAIRSYWVARPGRPRARNYYRQW